MCVFWTRDLYYIYFEGYFPNFLFISLSVGCRTTSRLAGTSVDELDVGPQFSEVATDRQE